MNFFRRISILFYVTMIMSLGVYIIMIACQYFVFHDFIYVWSKIYSDEQLRIVLGCIGAFILLFNYICYSILSENLSRGNIIAFNASSLVSTIPFPPGVSGTPALRIVSLATTLSPIVRIV